MANTKPGDYDHLRKDDPVKAEVILDLDKVAQAAEKTNYGTHTLISAMIRARIRRANQEQWGEDHPKRLLATKLAALLEDGIY